MVVKGFMGSNVVVGVAKIIERPLLNVEVGGGWFGRTGFEGFVHAFVGAILLGAPGRDALVGDAELEPPDVEPIQPVNASGSKRGPIVAANRVGEPALPKEVAELGFDARPADVREGLAAEQVPAEVIDDR